MQGERAGVPAGPDVWETCRELIPAGSVFAFLAEHREALFPAGMFADMYPSPNGRPSLPPQVLAAAVVLQALHGLSDFETVQVLRCDLRWKAACGLGLLDMAFDPSLLTYFRRRLARSADPNRLFFRVRQVVAATGVLAGKNRRALDSVVLDDAVATQDTVTQLIAAVRRVIREVPGAPEVAGRWCTAHDYADPGKPKIAWADEAARATLVDALVTDALSLLRHLPRQRLSEQAATAVGLLALVAGQDVEPAKGSDGSDGRWRIAKRTARDRVISTVDPDARHLHKNRTRHLPGRAHGRPGPPPGRRQPPGPVQNALPRLPAARTLHHRHGRASPHHPPPPRPAGRRPPHRRRPGLARRIPPVAPPGRTRHRLARRPRQPPRPLPRRHQKQHLAPPPGRRPQPPPASQSRTHPHQRRQLGTRIAPRGGPPQVSKLDNPPSFSVAF